jgi:hypothetical protein
MVIQAVVETVAEEVEAKAILELVLVQVQVAEGVLDLKEEVLHHLMQAAVQVLALEAQLVPKVVPEEDRHHIKMYLEGVDQEDQHLAQEVVHLILEVVHPTLEVHLPTVEVALAEVVLKDLVDLNQEVKEVVALVLRLGMVHQVVLRVDLKVVPKEKIRVDLKVDLAMALWELEHLDLVVRDPLEIHLEPTLDMVLLVDQVGKGVSMVQLLVLGALVIQTLVKVDLAAQTP